MGGTSMSNPLVAGGAAVVRDYYQKLHGHSASAALVKATLINSARGPPRREQRRCQRQRPPHPELLRGLGTREPRGGDRRLARVPDDETGLSTGGASSHSYDVAGGTPFKVTLAWSDYPGIPSAAKMLVNDLDLEVSGPGGVFYRGNVFAGGLVGRGWRRRQHEQRRERLRAVPGRGHCGRSPCAATTCPRGRSPSPSSSGASSRPDRQSSTS